MWNLTLKRILRSPLPAVGVVLFTMVMTVVLQSLHHSKVEAEAYYEEIYHEIDVTCTVTNPKGTNADGLELSNEVINLFTGYLDFLPAGDILPLLENVQIKSTHPLGGALADYTLAGITSMEIARELWPENGCTIFWNDGFDKSLFEKSEMACIIPQKLAEDLTETTIPVTLELELAYIRLPFEPGDFEGTMQVAGVYRGGNNETIYCSWSQLMDIWAEMGQVESASAIHASLRNNDDIESLREASSAYFAEPDPKADPADWGYALDIDDSQLQQANLTLRNSLRVNELSTLLVFILAAGAGFLIGFLMIRSRKREIALMRTMGASHPGIFAELALEQMLCVVLGIVLGGSYAFWQPVQSLALFGGIYFVGLSIALIVFLRKNLLTTIKEDE